MSSGIQSHWISVSRTVAQLCIFAGSVRVTINQASINDLPADEKSVHSSLFPSLCTCGACTWEAAYYVCVRVLTTLQSGCLLLAGRCGLINFDRLPLGPTTNTRNKETRQYFHHRTLCPCSSQLGFGALNIRSTKLNLKPLNGWPRWNSNPGG